MAADFFLKLEGIKGESADAKHKETIDIDSVSFGVSNAGISASGGGGGSGKASFQDVHFSAKLSKASNELFLRCATGEHIKKAEIIMRKAGKEQQEFFKIVLEDVLVSSYQVGAHEGSGIPTEQFSLNFAKIKVEYKPQKADGTLDSAVATGYDVKANKKL